MRLSPFFSPASPSSVNPHAANPSFSTGGRFDSGGFCFAGRAATGTVCDMGARRTGGLLAAALLAAAAAGCRPRAAPDLAPFSAATEPGRTVFFVPVRERLVALTFDDGPSEPYTGRILDVLRDRGVPATFFLIGANAERLPALARRVAAEGHLVGNHSYAHRRFDQSTAGEIARDIADGARAIEAATGVRPAWFRPPYGINGPGMEDACRAGGQVIAGWSADANDWNPHPVEELVERLAAQAVPGDILLLHDGWETRPDADRSRTAAAVSLVIDRLKAAGFRFVTVADLLRAAGPPLAAFANGARLLGIQAPAAPLRPGEAGPPPLEGHHLAVHDEAGGALGKQRVDEFGVGSVERLAISRQQPDAVPVAEGQSAHPVELALEDPVGVGEPLLGQGGQGGRAPVGHRLMVQRAAHRFGETGGIGHGCSTSVMNFHCARPGARPPAARPAPTRGPCAAAAATSRVRPPGPGSGRSSRAPARRAGGTTRGPV